MVKVFLITRPNHDVNTSYLHDFAKAIASTAKETEDIHVTDLEGSRANRINFENVLINKNPGLVFLNGHGDRKSVTGHKDEVILDTKNIHLTKEKIVYALSCDSLEELGEIAIQNSAKAYVGYEASFMIIHDPSRAGTPSKDNNALPFRKACSTLINGLVFGLKVGEAIKKTKQEYIHSIRSYGTSEDDPFGDVPLIRFALAWDLEYLGMKGDPNASFQ